MLYQITLPPIAAPEKQAEELRRLLKHAGSLTAQFVTVAGNYKPSRARLFVLAAPDAFAEQTARVIGLICGHDDAAKPSQPIRIRSEWKHNILLLPTGPDAPALDGAVIDGWHSACLSVHYRPGRVMARLAYCPEDREHVAKLHLDGWQILPNANPFIQITHAAGRPWAGVPSFAPVLGGVPVIVAQQPAEPHTATLDAPLPIEQEVHLALAKDASGFVLGTTPDGAAIHLARRAITVALDGSPDAGKHALLALLERGLDNGMGMVVAVERSLLPTDTAQPWNDRVRLLDVQNHAGSCAIPWREIAPDLLAQAIGGPAATLPVLPSRFGAVLDALGAEALRVPEILGLVAAHGDDLRGVIAAGGILLVPQDGDLASAIVARVLLAYLATPPNLGRALLLAADPSVILPEALQQQAMQFIFGKRNDALLSLGATASGWTLAQPDGVALSNLQPNLFTQPMKHTDKIIESLLDELAIGLPTNALDTVLGNLFDTLLAETPIDATEASIRDAVANIDFDRAEATALTWSANASHLIQPWLWRVVLSESDAERFHAARQALRIDPVSACAALLQTVLDAGGEPRAPSPQLEDGAIWKMWQNGESIPQLVTRLVASGVDASTARTRVRAITTATTI